MAKDKLTNVVTEDLDGPKTANTLAREARHSRSHFFRLFRAINTEPPAAMRRRLLLERAAWSLTNTKQSITEIAFDANYNSLEAFTRAFHKAFKLSPSLYRRLAPTHFHLTPPTAFTFSPRKEITTWTSLTSSPAPTPSTPNASSNTPSPSPMSNSIDPFTPPSNSSPGRSPNATSANSSNVSSLPKKSGPPPWPAPKCPSRPRNPCPAPQLLKRFQQADTKFQDILKDVRNRGAWDDTFVDALCEPPEKFSFGGTFAHVITYNTYRRLTALDALRRLGVDIEGFGCPMEYESATVAAQ